ncbi:hypothetical protein [Agromyces sp. GXS1127]|uniref:hypothetical protein n=1 Tax=Agromyces sp. GXS1127 TaxID=3424181 RepID=UPI003D31D373
MIAQLWTAVLLGIAALGSGAGVASVVTRRLPVPPATRIALIGAGGLAVIGVATLLVGHLLLLGPWLPYGLAGLGVLLGVLARTELVDAVRAGWRGMARQFRTYPVPLAAVSLCLAVAAVATLAPPSRRDEIEYHWPAPLDWAASGGWTDSPFKHVDGFPFMEIVYTSAATQGSYVAAHLLHFGAFLTLGFAVAGVAASMGIRGTGVTAAAALAMPVVWDSAYAAYNDTPVATFTVLAVAIVLAAPRESVRAVVVAGILIALATSVKPTGIAGIGIIGLVILLRFLFGDTAVRTPPDRSAPDARPSVGRLLAQLAVLVAPATFALIFWSVRQYAYTGFFVDPAFFAEPSADALSRLPDTAQKVLAPFLPFVSGIIGAGEPWGGRTALVIQLFLIPVLVYVIWRRGAVLRRTMLMLVPAWAHWILLGFRIVRTRFHVASWALMVVAVRIGVEDFARRHPRARFWLEAAWTVCILLGLVDVSFEMFRHIRAMWG